MPVCLSQSDYISYKTYSFQERHSEFSTGLMIFHISTVTSFSFSAVPLAAKLCQPLQFSSGSSRLVTVPKFFYLGID